MQPGRERPPQYGDDKMDDIHRILRTISTRNDTIWVSALSLSMTKMVRSRQNSLSWH